MVAVPLLTPVTMPRAIDERRISTALHQIEESSSDVESDDLSLASLARQAGMSRYHFLRTFRRIVGMTPHQYLLHIRMRRAALWIRATREPLTAVALNAGFNDLSTFSRRFRGVMGASPSAYRSRPAVESDPLDRSSASVVCSRASVLSRRFLY